MADDTKMGMGALARFGSYVDSLIENDPVRARHLLVAAFKAEGLRCRLLPHKQLLPSGQLDNRINVDAITDALAHPDESVITSLFMPSEIFLALGLRPVLAEAVGSFFSGAWAEQGFVDAAERRSVPETYCSYHKILVGAAATGVIAAPPLIANCSLACDANNLTFRYLAERLEVPQVYIDVPYEPSEEAVSYVADELRELARVAQETFGRTLDEERLRAHVARSQRALDVMERSLSARRGKAMHTTMTIDMFRACTMHMLLGSQECDEVMSQFERDIDSGTESFYGLNLLWVHTMPYCSIALQKDLDENPKVQVIASDMSFDQHRKGGFRHGPNEPYESMAERLVYDSFNGPAERRIDRALELAEKSGADGAVVFCHWGCKETLGASQLMKKTFEEHGLPTLVLDGDGCVRKNMSDGQTSTRMDAFLEMLEAGKANA